MDTGYVYIFKIQLGHKNNTKILYSVGFSTNKPINELQKVLLSIYETIGYFPKATILKQYKVCDYEQLTKQLQKELSKY